MIFLPSLLEYSKESFEKRLESVLANLEKFKQMQQVAEPLMFQETTPIATQSPLDRGIYFHLDFVLPQFAKDRSVMASIGLDSVFSSLEKYFKDFNLVLSIHLMGEVEDLLVAYDFFLNYRDNKNWKYQIFVPENYTQQFSTLAKIDSNVEIGIWYDLGEWEKLLPPDPLDRGSSGLLVNSEELIVKNYLLMTVVAGKSGQKLTEENKEKVLKIVKENPDLNFIVDGGWAVNNEQLIMNNYSNLQIVSYTSFWESFAKEIGK